MTAILMADRTDEFSRISNFFAPLSKGFGGAFNLTDDAAVISPNKGCELVVTTDTIVETIHFLGHESAADIAHKLIAVNFSDLAGKGAIPKAYSLNLSLPSSVDDHWLKDFTAELLNQQNEYKCHLIGGDSVSLPDGAPITLSITAFGEVPKGKMLRRNSAKPGDLVCVSGTLGDGALGLMSARGDLGLGEGAKHLQSRYYRPTPRIALGTALQGKATASMDVSDGLLADMGHMAVASGVAAVINISALPLSRAAADVIATDPNLMELVLAGGDDYELLFTIDKTHTPMLESLAKQSETALSVIGEIKAGVGVTALDRDGKAVLVRQSGFRHT